MSGADEASKRYWSRLRQLSTVAWLTALALSTLLPSFIPFCLIATAGSAIFFDRLAFRTGLALTLVLACGTIYRPHVIGIIVDGLNARMQDAFFQLRGSKRPTGQVVIVDLDQKSLEELGQWPWPRTEIATAIDNITNDGAAVIGFDVLFAEPDRLSLVNWIERVHNLSSGLTDAATEATGSFRLPDQRYKEIVFADWKKRLTHLDSTASLASEEEITAGYLSFRRRLWEEEETIRQLRLKRLGIDYEPQPYQPPSDPLKEMAHTSRELFYVRDQIADDNGHRLILDNDHELGRAMRKGRSVAGGLFVLGRVADAKLDQIITTRFSREREGMILHGTIRGDVDSLFPGIRTARRQVLNVEEVQEQALHQGMLNVVPDQSGAARYYAMIMRAPVFQESLVLKPGRENANLLDPANYDTKLEAHYYTYPSLALEMFRVGEGYAEVEAGYKGSRRGLYLRQGNGFRYPATVAPRKLEQRDAHFVPLDFKAEMPVNYLGYGGRWQPESPYPRDHYFSYYSLSDVVQKTLPPGTFKDKYVLIGSTDPTLADLVGSPFRPAFPGVEVHATVLENLLSQDFIIDYGHWTTLYTFLGILAGGTLLALALAYSSVWGTALATLLALVLLPAIGYYGLATGGFIFNFVYPWLSAGLTSASVTLVSFFLEREDKRFVVNHFSTMVSGQVLDKLRDDPNLASLGGQRATVSVFISDVEGFSRLSELLSPKELVSLLNDYFTAMSDIILKQDGFIDKFMGDAIMAVWGVPYRQDNYAEKACLAALKQQQALETIRPLLKKRYGVPVNVRMGIATGEVSAALMGSERRKSYTVMGDRVNIAARLESACRLYGCNILICGNTYEEVRHRFLARCVDQIILKGKSIPLPIYQLLGERATATDKQIESVKCFEAALSHYRNREWDEALAALDKARSLTGDGDPVETRFHSRILRYKKEPPPDDWDGSAVQTSK